MMPDKAPAATFMDPREFKETLRLLGLTASGAAGVLHVSPSIIFRYQKGAAPIPAPIAMLLRVMLYKRQDPGQVSALAFPLTKSKIPPRGTH
jgi:hypothetical protein